MTREARESGSWVDRGRERRGKERLIEEGRGEGGMDADYWPYRHFPSGRGGLQCSAVLPLPQFQLQNYRSFIHENMYKY